MEKDYAELIKAIREGEDGRLQKVYLTFRQPFLEWAAASYQFPEHEAKDVYQEVILIFYENIIQGKINTLKSHIRTYLFGIGKLLIRQKYKKSGRFSDIENEQGEPLPFESDIVSSHSIELTQRQKVLKLAIKSLGEKCRNILTLYYYHRYTTESLMNHLGYKSTDVVKSQKARCMKSLKRIILKEFDKDVI